MNCELPENEELSKCFKPTTEFEQHEWISIHLGPLDLSITRRSSTCCSAPWSRSLLGLVPDARPPRARPDRRQTVGETIYEIAQTQVAEQGLPGEGDRRWFPYVATLMLFIWVVNMLGFIPLPLTGETWHGVPRPGASTRRRRRSR